MWDARARDVYNRTLTAAHACDGVKGSHVDAVLDHFAKALGARDVAFVIAKFPGATSLSGAPPAPTPSSEPPK